MVHSVAKTWELRTRTGVCTSAQLKQHLLQNRLDA